MKQAKLFKKEQEALNIIRENPFIDKYGLGAEMGITYELAGVYISKLQKKGYLNIQRILLTDDKKVLVK